MKPNNEKTIEKKDKPVICGHHGERQTLKPYLQPELKFLGSIVAKTRNYQNSGTDNSVYS